MTNFYAPLSGWRIGDQILNLLALRYGTSSGVITLESFITLILRLECMTREYTEFGLCAGTTQLKKKTYRNVDSVCKKKRIMSFSIEIFKQLSDGKAMTLQEPEVNEMSGIISCTWIQFLDVTFFHLQRIWSEEKGITCRNSNLLQCWCKQTTGYSSFLCPCLIYISNLILCSGCSCQCTLDSIRKGRETGFIAQRLNR